MYDYLLSQGLNDAVVAAQADIATYMKGVTALLKCDTIAKDPACEVSFDFQAAVNRNHITYTEAVRLARPSLQYSFLPGEPLWLDVVSSSVVSQCAGEIVGNSNPGEPCKIYLGSNEKAGAQWRYETKLSGFDKEYGATLRAYLGN